MKAIEAINLTVTSPKKYEVTIGGESILFNKTPDMSMSKTEKKNQEKIAPDDAERLYWKQKAYIRNGKELIVPGENLHQCMKDGAKYWGQKIPGEGNKTFTDVIASAVICEDLNLNTTTDDLIEFGKNVNGNPSKGKKSTVYRIRPLLRPWGGKFYMTVFDKRLSLSVLQTILTYAGTFKGLCDWRPVYGRFEIKNIEEVGL
jgi:hypothetical protein